MVARTIGRPPKEALWAGGAATGWTTNFVGANGGARGSSQGRILYNEFPENCIYASLSFYGGIAHPAWSDNSDSTGTSPDGALHQLDIYTAAVPVP